MSEARAQAIADAMGAGWTAFHSGGGIWLVVREHVDGSLIAIGDEAAHSYATWDNFYAGYAVDVIEYREAKQ